MLSPFRFIDVVSSILHLYGAMSYNGDSARVVLFTRDLIKVYNKHNDRYRQLISDSFDAIQAKRELERVKEVNSILENASSSDDLPF